MWKEEEEGQGEEGEEGGQLQRWVGVAVWERESDGHSGTAVEVSEERPALENKELAVGPKGVCWAWSS